MADQAQNQSQSRCQGLQKSSHTTNVPVLLTLTHPSGAAPSMTIHTVETGGEEGRIADLVRRRRRGKKERQQVCAGPRMAARQWLEEGCDDRTGSASVL